MRIYFSEININQSFSQCKNKNSIIATIRFLFFIEILLKKTAVNKMNEFEICYSAINVYY